MAGINGARPGSGKGAFKYGGGKRMSGKEFPMGSGKMSSSQGCTGQSKDNNMSRRTGGDMIGSDCPTFRRAPYASAAGDDLKNIKTGSGTATRHAGQPSGHKDKA